MVRCRMADFASSVLALLLVLGGSGCAALQMNEHAWAPTTYDSYHDWSTDLDYDNYHPGLEEPWGLRILYGPLLAVPYFAVDFGKILAAPFVATYFALAGDVHGNELPLDQPSEKPESKAKVEPAEKK